MTAISPNSLPKEPGRGRALALAALVHIVLLSFLWIGVQWQNRESTAVEAEVWDIKTREAAPLPPPAPAPDEQPQVKEPPKPVVQEPPKEDPEIALQQEKKRKLEEKLKAEREEQLKKEKEKQLEKEQAEKEKAEKLAAQEADKKKLADAKKKEQAAMDKLFQDQMRRNNSQIVPAGKPGTGDAARSTGNNRGDPSYIAKVAAKIKSNTNIAGIAKPDGNDPTVEFDIFLLPDGSLRGAIRKLKSSGSLAFDSAVERGIEASQPIPRKADGTIPPTMTIVLHVNDFVKD